MPRLVEQDKLLFKSRVRRGKLEITEERENRSFWVYTKEELETILQAERAKMIKLFRIILDDKLTLTKTRRIITEFEETGSVNIR